MNSTPRILFLGYSEVGCECLSLLFERGDNVVALVTHEDNPNEKIWFKTPAAAAREHKPALPVYTPASIDTSEWIARIRDEIRPDLILSVYYRNMVGARVLEIPRLGAFNMHGSLLPKYRGRAPINWAVLHGEPRIGMTLHKMVRRADAGDIIDQEGVDIGPRDTAEQAFRKVLPCARAVLARQIDALLSGTALATPQNEADATYFGGRKPEDGRIDFTKTSAEIFNLIRAVTDPYPGAFTDIASASPADVAQTAKSASVSTEPAGMATGATPPPARLMIWWAEITTRPPAAANARPGEILSLAPLIVATADGALELTRTEWRGAPSEALRVGRILR